MERFGTPADTFSYLTLFYSLSISDQIPSMPSTFAKLFFWSMCRSKANLSDPCVGTCRKLIAVFFASTPSECNINPRVMADGGEDTRCSCCWLVARVIEWGSRRAPTAMSGICRCSQQDAASRLARKGAIRCDSLLVRCYYVSLDLFGCLWFIIGP